MSLEFARRRDLLNELSRQVVQGVQRHPRDFNSPEVGHHLHLHLHLNLHLLLHLPPTSRLKSPC